jgi:hypothetical protein
VTKNPRNYPDTLRSAESGRSMVRGEKQVTFTLDGQKFTYMQPGWWCSLTDPSDMEGQLADEDNLVAEIARHTAKAFARGDSSEPKKLWHRMRLVKTLTHPDGLRRVHIVERTSGQFGYEVEECVRVYEDPSYPDEKCWVPNGQYPLSICDSAETAEREARGRVAWLNDG